MNRVLRAGLMIPAIMFVVMGAAWVAGGGGGYGGTPEYYPVTVRLWLNDSFVGGISPAITILPDEVGVLDLLAAGNDLILVDDDAPRCPVWSVAWVSPAPGTPTNAQVYNATIRCAKPDQPQNPLDKPLTVEELLNRVGP